MTITIHTINNHQIAEVRADAILIHAAEDGLDLLGNLYYQDADRVILHEKNITPAFFDLKNGIAGELLQKFSNYRIRLVLVGDFEKYTGKSIRDFMYESNNGKQVNFVNTLQDALQRLAN